MSKMLEATCVAGIVTADGVPVPTADILSEGVGASEGILILEEDEAKYLAKISPDLKSTLEKLSSVCDTIKSGLQAIDAVTTLITTCGAGAGTATWLPVNASAIAALTTAKAEIDALKASLR
jgi:hypothetical protein